MDTIIVGQISDLVVEMLANQEPNYITVPTKPLTDGKVLLGRHHWAERSSASHVVFVPTNSDFGPPATKDNWVQSHGVGPDGRVGFDSRLIARPLATDRAAYLVYCWGEALVDDREHDFDATRWLAHTVMRACSRLAMASCRFFRGEGWTDQRPDGPALMAAGHEFSFGVTFDIPVIDSQVQFPPTTLKTVNTLEIE